MKHLGYILWFDENKGEGQVFDSESKQHLYFHYSAIKEKQTELFKKPRNLSKFQAVEFSIYENLYMKQIDSIIGLDFFYFEDNIKLNQLMNKLFEDGDGNALLVNAF